MAVAVAGIYTNLMDTRREEKENRIPSRLIRVCSHSYAAGQPTRPTAPAQGHTAQDFHIQYQANAAASKNHRSPILSHLNCVQQPPLA